VPPQSARTGPPQCPIHRRIIRTGAQRREEGVALEGWEATILLAIGPHDRRERTEAKTPARCRGHCHHAARGLAHRYSRLLGLQFDQIYVHCAIEFLQLRELLLEFV
jgi:hypothetical protein